MAKYTVAVCDDEKEDLSFLVRKITEYDTHQLFEIKTYTDGELLFDELKSQKTSIDLLLLDIEMPSNGFQLARTLQALPKHPMVIFVTRQHEYAVQGYGIAFRYLTKPLNNLCAVTGSIMEAHDIHCHHKRPAAKGGTDEYGNLVLISAPVHKLIHASDMATIKFYLNLLNLDSTQILKLNKFREMAEMPLID